jgi:hypothetical protein
MGEPEREARHPALDQRFTKPAGVRPSSHEPRQEGSNAGEVTSPHGLDEWTLNLILGASFAFAPLDTQFLYLLNGERGWVRWVPVSLINDMKGLDLLGCASVRYYVQGIDFTYVEDSMRVDVAPDVASAYAEQEKNGLIGIDVFLQFKPPDYGPMTQSLFGQWKSCVDNQGKEDVRLITSFPFTGAMMSIRLDEHELYAGLMSALTEDPREQEALKQVADSVSRASQQMPQGFADHIHCVATARLNDQNLPTVLATWRESDAAGSGAAPSSGSPEAVSPGSRPS